MTDLPALSHYQAVFVQQDWAPALDLCLRSLLQAPYCPLKFTLLAQEFARIYQEAPPTFTIETRHHPIFFLREYRVGVVYQHWPAKEFRSTWEFNLPTAVETIHFTVLRELHLAAGIVDHFQPLADLLRGRLTLGRYTLLDGRRLDLSDPDLDPSLWFAPCFGPGPLTPALDLDPCPLLELAPNYWRLSMAERWLVQRSLRDLGYLPDSLDAFANVLDRSRDIEHEFQVVSRLASGAAWPASGPACALRPHANAVAHAAAHSLSLLPARSSSSISSRSSYRTPSPATINVGMSSVPPVPPSSNRSSRPLPRTGTRPLVADRFAHSLSLDSVPNGQQIRQQEHLGQPASP